MTSGSSSITTERKGYSRGLILGLTMAETFLLLVFCLLLVAAAAIAEQRKIAERAVSEQARLSENVSDLVKERNNLAAETDRLAQENAQLEQTIAKLPKEVVAAAAIDEDWRELVLMKDAVKALVEANIDAEALKKLAPAMEILVANGFLVPSDQSVRARLEETFKDAEKARNQKPHEWPPIINLSEAGGYYFAVGSAALSSQFRSKLNGEIAGTIASYLDRYNVDIVEVIGHTDEQPLSGQSSNLDKTIGDVLRGSTPVTEIRAADNAGLGLARAVAVTQVLRGDPRLSRATILPLSGAQLIVPGDELSDGGQTGDIEARRRIEIRVRRRSTEAFPSAPSTP